MNVMESSKVGLAWKLNEANNPMTIYGANFNI